MCYHRLEMDLVSTNDSSPTGEEHLNNSKQISEMMVCCLFLGAFLLNLQIEKKFS